MISISLPLPPTGLRAPGSPASTAPPGDFALALADMLVIPDAGAAPPAAVIDRQIDAAPGKVLPVGGGVDAIDLNPDVTDSGSASAQPASGAGLPQPATVPVPPAQKQPRPTAPDDVPIERERSVGEERAHARKEAIAALPLPIPAGVVPMDVPNAPPASSATDIASSAASGSRRSAIAPVSSTVIASPKIAAAPPSDRPVTTEMGQNQGTDERAVASPISRLAPDPRRGASAAAPIDTGQAAAAIRVDPVAAQSSQRPAVDTTVPAHATATSADAPMRPARFLPKQVAVAAEQRPSSRAAPMVAKEEPGRAGAGPGNAALPPSQSPKPGTAATASASPRGAGVATASAVQQNFIAVGAEGARPRDSSGVTERAATLPPPAERRVGRAKGLEAPRPDQAPAIANTRPAIDAADGGTLRPRSSAAGQIDIAAAHDPRPQIKTNHRAGRPAPAPIAPQVGASNPHRPAAPDALTPVTPAPSVQSAAPLVTPLAPPWTVAPVTRTHGAPERIADNGIAPAEAKPAAPAPRAVPVAPAAAPIAAMFGGPRPVDPRAPRAGEIGEAPAGLAHTLAATQTASSIQPVAETQRTPLDMRRDDWTQKLIDRIETIRDAANAADTRIKLMPDALGKIDVSMRKDGDTVHVAFTADVPATRAMLADAQPRLAELAQQRGLRLGQASVDAGTNGDGQQRQAPAPSTPARSIRAAEHDEALTETGRVA